MSKALCRLTEAEARLFLEGVLWPDGPVCPRCKGKNARKMEGKSCRPGLYNCRDCRKPFTVTVGTIFERSHYPLRDWVYVFTRMCASKKGISAKQIERELDCQYRTAWFMCHRIRHAMADHGADPLVGEVEVDEAYVGGKPRKGGPKSKRGRGTKKTPIVALVERGGTARARVVTDVTARTLKAAITDNVQSCGTIFTDEHAGYTGIGDHFKGGHKTVTHSHGEYARSDGANTNTVESYFALVKRGVYGNFHHVSKKHLQRYLDEFCFRWDHRKARDDERTVVALSQAKGKRLTYA